MDRKALSLSSGALAAFAAFAVLTPARAERVPPNVVMSSPLPTPAPAGASAATTPQTYGDPTPPATPLYPFYGSVFMPDNGAQSVGAGPGVLNVTNLVLTNFATTAQQVFIFMPIFAAGGHCGDPVQGGMLPRMQIYVQPSQTLVIPYPTPLTFRGKAPSCIAAEVTTSLNGGSVEMDVTGFYQPPR